MIDADTQAQHQRNQTDRHRRGRFAHADPASDWPAMLLAINATIICRSQADERMIKARDFFLDTFQTAIEPADPATRSMGA